MAHSSIPGRLGREINVKDVKGISVLEFSVAEKHPDYKIKDPVWYECSMWGNRERLEKLAEFLTTGAQVTVLGLTYPSEYNGKTKMRCKVYDVSLQGGGERRQQEGNNGHDGGTTADELDDALPF